ncbi:hypothetical protein [Nocardia sp. NPDC051832]|uniref:hypothetical protein n=1 Tax=Nocardia sp. NPDC051832 TaxID=3155673 RepID=UPI00341C889A
MPPKPDDGQPSKPMPEELGLGGNPWPAYKDRIENNAKWVTFDPEAALKLGTAISNIITGVRSLSWGANGLFPLGPFTTPAITSGEALSTTYTEGGEKMYQILDAHVKILNEMLDVVVAAAKNYENAETTNANDLAEIEKIAYPKINSPDYGGGKSYSIPKPSTDENGLNGMALDGNGIDRYNDTPKPDMKGAQMDKSVRIDRPSKDQPWKVLYDNGEHIRNNYVSSILADKAGQWSHIESKLREYYTGFNDQVTTAMNGRWEGDGALHVKESINKYVETVKPLQDTAGHYKRALEFAATFLDWTQAAAPPVDPEPKRGVEDGNDYQRLGNYQDFFDQTYGEGIEWAAQNVPLLSDPTTQFKGLTPLPKIPGDHNGDGKVNKDDQKEGDTNNDGVVDPEEARALAEKKAKEAAAKQTPGGGPPGGGPPSARPKTTNPTNGLTAAQKKQQQQAAERAKQDEQRRREFEEKMRKETERRAKEQEAYEKKQRADNDRRQAEAEQRAKEAAAKQEASRKEQEARAAAREAASSAQQAAQQGMEAAQKAVQEALSAGQQGATEALAAAQQAAQNSLNGSGLPKAADLAAKLGGGPGPGPSALAKGLGLSEAAKLFPRVGATTSALTTGTGAGLGALGSRAGAASQAMPGSPGPAGAAGQGAGQGQQAYKRPAYLESDAHLDELLGEAPKVVRPVVEQ